MLHIHAPAPVARLTGRKAVVNVAAVARPVAAGRAGQLQSVGVASQVRQQMAASLHTAGGSVHRSHAHTGCYADASPA